MRYLHTMIRVSDLEESLNFFKLLDIHEVSRKENEQARFTLVFLLATGDEKLVENAKSPLIETPIYELSTAALLLGLALFISTAPVVKS